MVTGVNTFADRLHQAPAESGAVVAQDNAQHPDAIPNGMEVRFARPSRQLDTWNLCDPETRVHCPRDHFGLDLEPGRREG